MADMSEIAVAMKRLTDAMPPPRGVDPAKAFAAYCGALLKFTFDEIEAGIDRYLAGECDEKISLKFYPRPPELARIVAGVRSDRSAEAEKAKRAEAMAAERREMAEAEVARKKTPEQIARADELMRRFHASIDAGRADRRAEREAVERARIRTAYGMTDEVIAAVKDRPLPKGMAPLKPPPIPPPPDRIIDEARMPKREDDVPFGGLG